MRRAQNRAVKPRLLAVVAASALVVGCGGHERDGRSAATVTTTPAPGVVGPGRLVGIGGGRRVFVECVGSGSPSVVLEAGLGANARSWQDVQAQIGRTTRTSAYDRAGVGSSVARPGVHGAREEVDDLRRMLDGAGIDPPYVLVGQSYGGLLVRLFARAHPEQTAG